MNAFFYFQPLRDCNLHDYPDNVMYYITAYNRSKNVQHPAASTHIDVPNHKVLNITLHARNSAGSANSRRELAIFPALFGMSLILYLWNQSAYSVGSLGILIGYMEYYVPLCFKL